MSAHSSLLHALALLLLLPLSACGVAGSGTPMTDARTPGAFESVEVGGALALTVKVGPSHGVTVSGDDNIVPLIKTEVVDKALQIKLEESVRPKTKLEIAVTAPTLRALIVSGAIDGTIEGVSGDAFKASLSGAGSLVGKGSVGTLELNVNGAASLDFTGVAAEAVKVNVSGAGEVKVHARQTLDANVSGAAAVRYQGEPKVTQTVSGAGGVSKLDAP